MLTRLVYIFPISEVGIDGLEFTKAWLKRSHDKITDVNAVEEAMSLPLATPAAIVNEAYIELLDWDEKNVIPEVKWLERIVKFFFRTAVNSILFLKLWYNFMSWFNDVRN